MGSFALKEQGKKKEGGKRDEKRRGLLYTMVGWREEGDSDTFAIDCMPHPHLPLLHYTPSLFTNTLDTSLSSQTKNTYFFPPQQIFAPLIGQNRPPPFTLKTLPHFQFFVNANLNQKTSSEACQTN